MRRPFLAVLILIATANTCWALNIISITIAADHSNMTALAPVERLTDGTTSCTSTDTPLCGKCSITCAAGQQAVCVDGVAVFPPGLPGRCTKAPSCSCR